MIRATLMAAATAVVLMGCSAIPPLPPPITSHERTVRDAPDRHASQSRHFETTKMIAFASVRSAFEDLGYTVDTTEIETGFIAATRPVKPATRMLAFLTGSTPDGTKATAFVEEPEVGTTTVRLTIVPPPQPQDADGPASTDDAPVEDPASYATVFKTIAKAITARSADQ